MANIVTRPSVSMNAEEMRKRIFDGVRLPPELLQKAIDNTERRLSAKKVHILSHQGELTGKIELEDWAAQRDAAQQIYTMAGLTFNNADRASQTPSGIELIIDAETGAVRLRIGHVNSAQPQMIEAARPNIDEISIEERRALESQMSIEVGSVEETLNDGSVILPTRRFRSTDELKKMLFEASQMRDNDDEPR